MTPAELAKRGAVLVAVALVAFSAGRFTAPERVETRVEFRELSVEELTRGMNFTRTVTRTIYRDVTTTITDAGTTITDRTVEREGDDTHRAETLAGSRSTEAAGETVRTVTVRPDWRVGVLAGASLRDPALPLSGPLVLGVEVDRRIVGGVSAGVWANTVGAAGVAVSVEF